MNIDCQAWNAWSLALRQAGTIKAFEVVDQMERTLNNLAEKILADPRRIGAVSKDCPKFATDIRSRAQAAGTPRQVADPAHSEAMLETWLASLPEEQLTSVEKAAKTEVVNRKKRKKK